MIDRTAGQFADDVQQMMLDAGRVYARLRVDGSCLVRYWFDGKSIRMEIIEDSKPEPPND